MFSYIRGELAEVMEEGIVIETGGVGFFVRVPQTVVSALPPQGRIVKIYTHFRVSEDAMQLYGFWHKDDLQVFRLLLSVNGIGPKAALGVLSGLSADELRFAVLSDDVKTLSRAPGIGKKTAQKLILELKDKLKLEDAFEKKLMHEQENADLNDTDFHDGRQEAVEALTALGYSSSEALKAVHKVTDVDPGDVEAILKAALKQL